MKIGGKFVAYKSEKVEEELKTGKNSIYVLGGELKEVVKFSLIGTEANRALAVIEKRGIRASNIPGRQGYQ